jgi:hypothetical protein
MPPGDVLEVGRRASSSRWLAVAASVVLVVGALAVLGSPRIGPTAATPAPSASEPGASPSASSSGAAASPGHSSPASPGEALAPLPLSFTGRSTCSTQDEGTTASVGTTEITTGIVVRCFDEASDPRVSGLGYRSYTMEVDPDAAERWYGTATRSNEGGQWAGVFSGGQPAGSSIVTLSSFWLGAGGYTGLQDRDRVRMRVEDGLIEIVDSSLEVVGPVAVTGQAACAGAARSLACRPDVDEPRLSGTWTLALRATARADGSAAVTGTGRIENGAGAWDLEVTGTRARDGRTWQLAVAATGTAQYAGFGYVGALDGPLGALMVRGTIAPAG